MKVNPQVRSLRRILAVTFLAIVALWARASIAQQGTPPGAYTPGNPVSTTSADWFIKGPRPWLDVRAWGAYGDTKFNSTATITTGANSTVTCATCAFTAADVGKVIYGIYSAGAGAAYLPKSTITRVTNATTVVTNGTGVGAVTVNLVWGHDDTAVLQAVAAAACASANGFNNPHIGVNGVTQNLGAVIFLPEGGYMSNAPPFVFGAGCIPAGAATANSIDIIGSGRLSTILYLEPGFAFPTAVHGVFIDTSGTLGYSRFMDFSINGADMSWGRSAIYGIQATGRENIFARIEIVGLGNSSDGYNIGADEWAFSISSGTGAMEDCFIQNNGTAGVQIKNTSVFYSAHNTISNNNQFGNGPNREWFNGTSETVGGQLDSIGDLIDECFGAAQGCEYVLGTANLYYSDFHVWGGPNAPAMTMDGTSEVNADNLYAAPYNTNANSTGVTVAAGGVFRCANCKLIGTGIGTGLNNSGTTHLTQTAVTNGTTNSGTLFDNCGNSFAGTNTNSGVWAGSCSITGTAFTTSSFALTSGWGTSSKASAAGDSHQFNFVITGAAGGAGPVVTITFPKAYVVAPAQCSISQTSGTFGVLTNPVISSLTNTGVVITWTGTPAANTYGFSGVCGP